MYQTEATSVAAFVQQLAVSYLANGYWFYVPGRIPLAKDPALVDAKLVQRYGIAMSKWARARRKAAGLANLQYLRYQRFLLLLATHPNEAFSRKDIIKNIKGENYPVTDRAVDVHIVELRKLLGTHGKYIKSVRGVGYKFKMD